MTTNAHQGDGASGSSDGGTRPADIVASRVETILAAQLHIADVVARDGSLHTVTSLRLQGAPPEVCIEFAGLRGRQHFPPTAPVEVLRRHLVPRVG